MALIVNKYVERYSSVSLYCKHNVEPEKLYKVTWLKNGNKVFEYINGRQPPYRNFSVLGAEIDVRSTTMASLLDILKSIFTFSPFCLKHISFPNQISTKSRSKISISTRPVFIPARFRLNPQSSPKLRTKKMSLSFVSIDF